MNVRFAEECRGRPLEFVGPEWGVFTTGLNDGRTQKDIALNCDKDIFIGVFFDGTNNNKYRDTPGYSHSNVARLYEVYPGTPAQQRAPKLLPKVNADGSKTERPIFPDKPFKPSHIAPEDFPYYRKIYVPGLGTPMPDVRDSGTGLQKTGGLATALLGQARLDWALLQLLNQVHAAIFQMPIEASVDLDKLYKRTLQSRREFLPTWAPLLGLTGLALQAMEDQLSAYWAEFERTTGTYEPSTFDQLLGTYAQRLSAALAARGRKKPDLRKIRLSVFGFSRGAAQARAWVNMITKRWAGALAGIPLQIDFLGIFDTVASVGLAQSTPYFEGHGAWAHADHMAVPSSVKRCVHLVAAHEVRGSFPLDSVCQGRVLPLNCKEIVYPGVHSDVGGGYPPGDQGRSLGQAAAGDALKLSQIALAQMYREARMAGVPLAPEGAMIGDQRANFAISPKLRADFNAYVAATRMGTVPPTLGKGEPQFARMFPTETQPREELHVLMRRHYGLLLRWRKAMMVRPGGIGSLPGVSQSQSDWRFQDAEDIRGAEEELKKEIAFLQNPDPSKFDQVDDTFFDECLGTAKRVAVQAAPLPPAQLVALAAMGVAWGVKASLRDVMKDKQRQWDTWLKNEWSQAEANAVPLAASQLFEHYVHDSRAWFKPFMRTDTKRMMPDDEDWFVFGGKDKERRLRAMRLQESVDKARKAPDPKALAQAEQQLASLQQEGQPLLVGGREPYRMWGYLRHRRLFTAGQVPARLHDPAQARIEQEEQDRLKEQRRLAALESEKAKYAKERNELQEQSRRFNADPSRTDAQKASYNDATRAKMARIKTGHERRLDTLREPSDTSSTR